MKNIKYLSGIFMLLLAFGSCKKKDYTLGDLTTPTNLTITTEIVGQSTANPNGDGSGNVKINATADNTLTYKIAYSVVGDNAAASYTLLENGNGAITKKFNSPSGSSGVFDFRITVIAYGKGGVSTTATKDIKLRVDFVVDPAIISSLTGTGSKTWVVDKSVAGHFGVGPWSKTSVTPEWWSAAINEKVSCCPCFYSATFKFIKDAATGAFSLQVATPDGAFTKTGSLASIPGIPSSGDEGCYSYSGGTSAFSFGSASSGIAASTPSTQVSMLLSGSTTFIGYGALQREYEILTITPTDMYLRVQGTETGNAWYIKLKSI